MGNIFDEANERKVPVNILLNGKKTTVGQAEITPGVDGIMHVQMDLKSDDAQDVIDLLDRGMVEGHSVDSPKHRMEEPDIQSRLGLDRHDHKPRQHRDGKPAWCRRCGLTADYKKPVSSITNANNFGFGQPANPLRGES